jgi:hypothetical protein
MKTRTTTHGPMPTPQIISNIESANRGKVNLGVLEAVVERKPAALDRHA